MLIEYRKYRDLDVGYIWKVSSEIKQQFLKLKFD